MKDEYSPFREYLRRAYRRASRRNKEIDITLQDLKEVWEKQNGICSYSKVELVHPIRTIHNSHIYTASLDRIDSSRGYIKDNIQFISIAMNNMKNTMTEDELNNLLSILKTL